MRPLVVAALACACLLGAAPAAADPPSTDVQAHQAYERGTSAYRRKDYATAAREYAAADALSPNPVALQAAIDAAVQADDPVLGLQLLERAKGAPRTSALLSTMLVAEQKFAHRTGRIGITCPAQPCLATIDGAAIDPSQPTVVRVGAHSVMVESGGLDDHPQRDGATRRDGHRRGRGPLRSDVGDAPSGSDASGAPAASTPATRDLGRFRALSPSGFSWGSARPWWPEA